MDLSVIIPYYNSGHFIVDALKSIEQYNGDYIFEVIIINDGSKDDYSLQILKELQESNKYIILHQDNQGAAVARNTGITHAKGEFILFLDSDNSIKPDYIEKGINALRQENKAAVYHSEREVFGETNRTIPKAAAFDIEKMIFRNYIDMCAVVRKTALQQVNGFTIDKELSSCEDWELWLKIHKKNWLFIYTSEKLFYYRVRAGSISDVEDINFIRSRNFITKTHSDLLRECYLKKYFKLEFIEKQMFYEAKYPLRKLVKTLYHKYFKKH